MTEQLEFWISKGCLVPKPELDDGKSLPERIFLDRNNLVKVISGPTGTTVRWHSFGANWASLFFAKEWIGTFPGPYTLNYYMSGWLSETYADPIETRDRIDYLIAKSDLHLSSRIYTLVLDPESRPLPDLIRKTYETGEAPPEASVDCSLDEESGRVKVERIGAGSAIAKLWGLSPVSTPCLSGTSYDKVTTKGYIEALRTGRPHYDHIYAAMMGRDGEVSWIPYQRIVMPHRKPFGRLRMVSVVSEITPVEIAVV
ncbi:MAG: hypothetical protein HY245_02685 [Rhizobiales bacterium]|nr:hypothetical protein [Hyphomicrobiales bacterium]